MNLVIDGLEARPMNRAPTRAVPDERHSVRMIGPSMLLEDQRVVCSAFRLNLASTNVPFVTRNVL